MTNFVYGYKAGSRSATALAQALGVRTIRHRNSKFVGRQNKTVINWGASQLPEAVAASGRIINNPEAIQLAGNKLRFFEAVMAAPEGERPNIPDFTTSRETAEGWFRNEEVRTVFARTSLTGHSGRGIEVIENIEGLAQHQDGTLFVKYIPKRKEFRLHVSRNGVFDRQGKLRRRETPDEEVNYKIRSHDNGFIFGREDLQLPADAEEQARRALAITGLDFGAVDIIYNQLRNTSYVLEVNTAPGLEGSTVDSYSAMIEGIL